VSKGLKRAFCAALSCVPWSVCFTFYLVCREFVKIIFYWYILNGVMFQNCPRIELSVFFNYKNLVMTVSVKMHCVKDVIFLTAGTPT
jgi:hypothetical protein